MISSGSRCAALVLAAGNHLGLRLWTNPDERSAAFFALGAAKGSHQPAALICTSGTAAANYFPAVIEAHMSGVPLVVMTADRPPRLRGTGAPQTIDQVRLYGGYALSFDDLPVPGIGSDDAREWMTITRRAVRLSAESTGPVHINTPFEEPLLVAPTAVAAILSEPLPALRDEVSSQTAQFPASVHAEELRDIGSLLQEAKKPIIVCGPQTDADNSSDLVISLADRINAPILADVASQMRRRPEAIAHYDLILRDEHVRSTLSPDLILRIGGLPTSKTVNDWIASSPAMSKIGISTGPVADPDRCLTHSVRSDCHDALKMLREHHATERMHSSKYHQDWKTLDSKVAALLGHFRTESEQILESDIVAQVCEQAGADTNVFLSNSMPIRWADMYASARAAFPRVLVNRGANGIDGIISTAAGATVASGRTTVCVIGDLTFLHDQNGLWRLSSEQVPLKIVILNNEGGGVFHFLPIASHADHFESLVAMPHGVELSHLALAHGIPHHRVDSADRFSAILHESLSRPGPDIIEVRTDRAFNFNHQQEVVRRVSETARAYLGID